MSGFNFALLANVSTNAECKIRSSETNAATSWTPYPGWDIWSRIVIWKVPLLLLLFAVPRPPLSGWSQIYSLLHLIADPIGSLSSLQYTLASCQTRSAKIKRELDTALEQAELRRPRSHIWKLYSLLLVSYGECNDSVNGDSSAFISEAMSILEREPEKFEAIRHLFHETARLLAADRCTTILPVTYAQLTFMQSFAFAFYNVVHATPISKALPTGRLLNVEAHSIAFSALFLWLIPAVYLSSIIGASQTEQSMPRQLNALRRQLLEIKADVPREILELLPDHIALPEPQEVHRSMALTTLAVRNALDPTACAPDIIEDSSPTSVSEVTELPSISDSISSTEEGKTTTTEVRCVEIAQGWQPRTAHLPLTPVLDTYNRIHNGGLYSSNSSNSHARSGKRSHLTQLPRSTTVLIRLSSLLLVIIPVIISCFISGRVPPEGFDCRHLAELSALLIWLLSWGTGRYISAVVREPRRQFWTKFAKELLTGAAVITLILITQWGIFNRCDCYTMWGRRPLANPISPLVAAALNHRFRAEWPALVGVGIALQLVACVAASWWYRLASSVYLQEDELGSGAGPWSWTRRRFVRKESME